MKQFGCITSNTHNNTHSLYCTYGTSFEGIKSAECVRCFLLKFLHKLSHYDLPLYFDIYRSYLNKIVTPYLLRKHPLPLPVIAHTFAESSLVFQLVIMKNNISVNNTLILKKIEERSHSHSGFSTYVKNSMLPR